MSITGANNKILERISRFDFLIDGKENEEDAGPVQLEFTDGTVLEMELASDGESVEFTWKDKSIVEEENKEADWFRIDLTEKEPFNQLRAKKVMFVDYLLFGAIEDSKEDMVVAGLGFCLEDGLSLVYYNAGDFAKVYLNEMPPPFEDSFKLIWKHGTFGDIINGK